MPLPDDRPITNRYYDLEYYCLTDDNTLLAKRNNQIVQIKPSEFQDNDLLLSYSGGSSSWQEAVLTKRIVKAGEPLVRLESQRGTFYLTSGHKMFLSGSSLEAAGNLTPEHTLLFSDNIVLPTDGDINPVAAYALGAWSAEGSSQQGFCKQGTGKWRLVWGLHKDEELFGTKILMGIKALCPYTNPQIEVFPEYTRRTVSVFNKEAVLFFDTLGALGLCHEKKIPSCIWHASKEAKFAYIAGLLEGDGGWNKNRVYIKLTSKALIDGLHCLLLSLGIQSSIVFEPREKPLRDTYILSIYGKINLTALVQGADTWWYGWKHLSSIQQYSTSQDGNTKWSIEHVDEWLQKLWPINFKDFQKQSGISQCSIERLFGSWNNCLRFFNYPLKRTRWSSDHQADPSYFRKLRPIVSYYNGINKVVIYKLPYDIEVFDFAVSETENFFLNSVVSHNSGSQASIYIGDVFVDEVTAIQWNKSQSKTPLYGYASQRFDGTARGQKIVTGSFTINFKESGYLWAVLRRWFSIGGEVVTAAGQTDPISNKKANMLRTGKLGAENSGLGGRPVIGSNGTKFSKASIERLLQGRASRQERYQFYRSLAGYATFSPGGGKDKVFEDIVEVFEDQLWKYPDNRKILEQLRAVDDNLFDGFDIYVLYGNYANPKANHTSKKIVGVRITGDSQMIVIDGQPLQETFQFLGRDVL